MACEIGFNAIAENRTTDFTLNIGIPSGVVRMGMGISSYAYINNYKFK